MIKPLELTKSDCPMVLLMDRPTGLVEWGIKWRTNSAWNHIAIMRKPGFIVSQNLTLKEIPIENYMKKNARIKFWKFKQITQEEIDILNGVIDEYLSRPWWERFYDFPGILGQATGLIWINIPWLRYCSESVLHFLTSIRKMDGKHPSPEDLDKFFKKTPECWDLFGYYIEG